jgi:hypothetical protein
VLHSESSNLEDEQTKLNFQSPISRPNKETAATCNKTNDAAPLFTSKNVGKGASTVNREVEHMTGHLSQLLP